MPQQAQHTHTMHHPNPPLKKAAPWMVRYPERTLALSGACESSLSMKSEAARELSPWMAMLAARDGCVFSHARSAMLAGRSVSERQAPSRMSLFGVWF